MEMNFCRRCGLPLTRAKKHVYSCKNNHLFFANCTPAVGIFLINENNELLLSVRGIEPHKGLLDAFGGFLDGEETFEQAIKRELDEELGLNASEYSKPQFLCSAIGHYPYKDEVLPLISCLFWARLQTNRKLIPGDDVAAIYITKRPCCTTPPIPLLFSV